MDELINHRKDKDDFFARDPDSPLTFEQKREFEG
jgi:hypothetical protein